MNQDVSRELADLREQLASLRAKFSELAAKVEAIDRRTLLPSREEWPERLQEKYPEEQGQP